MYILLPVILLAIGALIWFLITSAGRPCPMCGAPDMMPFGKLPQSQQDDIRQYFRDEERRQFRSSQILVCPKCKSVHDDFSGEKRSRDLDLAGMLRPACTSFCKCCGRIIMYNATHEGIVTCPGCDTKYAWRQYGFNELFFFSPQTPIRILDKPPWTLFDG